MSATSKLDRTPQLLQARLDALPRDWAQRKRMRLVQGTLELPIGERTKSVHLWAVLPARDWVGEQEDPPESLAGDPFTYTLAVQTLEAAPELDAETREAALADARAKLSRASDLWLRGLDVAWDVPLDFERLSIRS